MKGGPVISVKTRFLTKFESNLSDEECWPWKGQIKNEYGVFYNGIKQVSAHRFSYEYFVGPIPENFTVDHLCYNKSCINPFHLDAVTLSTNIQRAALSRKTVLKHRPR